MKHNIDRHKVEYGDFQTPLELAVKVCQKLQELNIQPKNIIEPTCGSGNFIEASAEYFPTVQRILGVDINATYIKQLHQQKKQFFNPQRIEIQQTDFFTTDWQSYLQRLEAPILFIGNLPWTTNSQQGCISGTNLPPKTNFQKYSGLEAITGKSNFDISEWMLIQIMELLAEKRGYIAILCKNAVARNLLNYAYQKKLSLSRSILYNINARKYFNAFVEACLLFCEFVPNTYCYDYKIYEDLDSFGYQQVINYHGHTIKNLETFNKLSQFSGVNKIKWRSGIKHDCAEIMELRQIQGQYINGLKEIVDIESTYLFPLLKGSDIANNRTLQTERYLLVTQKSVRDATDSIQKKAPKTWRYLEEHSHYLAKRKSKIYQNAPCYSIFGVGTYTFFPYKIAICGLYKNLIFRLVPPIDDRPVVFDDTVYFLSFENYQEAQDCLKILLSESVQEFYSTLIFWGDKRPIKAKVLNCLDVMGLNRHRLEQEKRLTAFPVM